MSMCRESLLLCCWKRVFAMIGVFSWQNSVSLCPALFCTPQPNFPITPGISSLPTFAFQSPKVCIAKAMAFPVVMYGCKTWTIKNTECRRTDADAETPIFWQPDAKNWLTGKDSDAGKDSWQEEKGTIQDEMVGWHHRLHTHEFEQALGDGEGQGSLVCYSPWGHKEQDTN